MLTRKQQELLLFIHERMKESGVPPSFDEMKDALDLASKSGIHRLITALEETRLHPPFAEPRPRTRSDQASGGLFAEHPAPPRLCSERDRRQPRQDPAGTHADQTAVEDNNSSISVPVMGRIAAGVPISAIQNNTHDITVPPR